MMAGATQGKPSERQRQAASRIGGQACRALAAAQQTSTAITSRADPGEALQEIATAAMRVVGGDTAGVFVISADGRHLETRAAAGEGSGETLGSLLRLYETGKAWRVLVAQGGLVIGDAERHPHLRRYRQLVRERSVKSLIAAQLMARGRVLGVIAVSHRRRTCAFSQRDLRSLRLFADQAALALGTSRLRARAEKWKTRARGQRALTKELLDDVRDPVLLLDAHGRIIFGNQALFDVLGRQPADVIGRPWQEIVDPADAERIAADGAQPDASGVTQREIHVVRADGTRTPVLTRVRHGRDAEQRLVECVVGQVDFRDRQRTEQTLERREAMLDTIGGLTRAAGRAADARRLGAQVLDSGLRLLGLKVGSMHFVEDGHLVLVAARGMSAGEVAVMERLPISGTISKHVLDSGKPIIYADVRRSRRLDPELRRLCRPDARSVAVIPIPGRNAAIGVLRMNGPEPAPFTRRAIGTVKILAAQFGAAVENMRLCQAAQRHAERLAFLNETAMRLMSCTSQEEAERVLRREMARALRARRIVSLDYYERRESLKVGDGYRVSRARLRRAPWMRPSEAPLAALAVSERQPVACEDVVRQQALPAQLSQALGLRSVIAVPVIEGRRLWHVLLADNGKQPITLSPEDAEMAMAVANQAAATLGTMFRLNKARRCAEQLTISMREADHRIKNNLQAICDVLELELMERKTDAWAAVERSLQRVRTIATVHESLISHDDAALVDADQVLQRLVPLVVTASQRPGQAVQVKVEACPLTQNSKRTTALALIVNELVGNAVRHGLNHDKRSMVRVSVTERNGTICLRVTDNGAGLPEGFDPQRDAHVGLEIARVLAERELNGRLVLERRRGRATGTVASVRFSK